MRIAATAIAIAILAIAIGYRIATPESTSSTNTPAYLSASTRDTTLLDTDSDGIPDWVEDLLGSDPRNALSAPTTTSSTRGISATSSATDVFSYTLLQQYLSTTRGGTIPLNDPATLGAKLANSITVSTPTYRIYTIDDLSTISNTPSNRAAYTTALEEALAPLQTITEAEIKTYGRLITGDDSAAVQLQAVADTYKRTTSAMADISVPQEAAVLHRNALNALSSYAASLSNLITHIDDPIGSLIVLRAYNEAERDMFNSFETLKKYLSDYTITP